MHGGATLKAFFMAKRFTDSAKFRDPWYRKLNPKLKCLWEYLLSECDMAGIIDIDLDAIEFHIGEPIELSDIESFGDRVYFLEPQKIFIPKFVKFQQNQLNPENRAHKNIILSFEKYGLPLDLNMDNYLSPSEAPCKPLPRGQGISNSKGTSISNSKVTRARDNTENIILPDFIDADIWTQWIQHRKEIRKPLKPTQSQAQIKKLKAWHEQGVNVNEAIMQSVSQGWTGLFKPDENKQTKTDNIKQQTQELIENGW